MVFIDKRTRSARILERVRVDVELWLTGVEVALPSHRPVCLPALQLQERLVITAPDIEQPPRRWGPPSPPDGPTAPPLCAKMNETVTIPEIIVEGETG